MKHLASCLLLAIAGIGGASAASFDCKKAVTRVEKLVCADASLSLFDEQLDAAYRNGLSRSTSPDAFRAAQRRWLATQRDACGDLACLQRAYVARVDALANESTANPSARSCSAILRRASWSLGSMISSPSGRRAWV